MSRIDLAPLPELEQLEQLEELAASAGDVLETRVLGTMDTAAGSSCSVLAFRVGSADPRHPTLGLFGGVLGRERVGTQIAYTALSSLVETLRWDRHARRRFDTCRVVAIPLVSLGGMAVGSRSKTQGGDLMRNAPVEAEPSPTWLVGGQRVSRRLPWYCGESGAPLEREARLVVEFVERELFEASCALSIDYHSGFGALDRLWYPWAKTTQDFPRGREARRLAQLLRRTYPEHRYLVEPQAHHYSTHGDLWDYLFERHWQRHGDSGPVFVPWTLEVGSWSWVRTNPRQPLSLAGPFNPVAPHRFACALRRHLLLSDFFIRAVHNPHAWASPP